MEIKKSPKADLEKRRTFWFFVGFIINVSIFIAMLEWTPSQSEITTEKLKSYVDNVVKTVEMIPAEESVPDKVEKEKSVVEIVSDDIEVVDDAEIIEETVSDVKEGSDAVTTISKETIDKPLERKDVVTDLTMLEEIPSYSEGMSEFVKWLTSKLRYPESARRDKLQGSVTASFIIEEDGSISKLEIVQSLRRDCDDEVLRVLSQMKAWIPGKKNGKPCRTLFCIPIEFKL